MVKIVAVVNCISGVAHSYIARNALIGGAEKKGYEISVEIQGTLGLEYKLSQEQIDEADVVIWSKDVKVREARRFEGKKILHDYYSRDLIKRTDQVLKDAVQLIDNETGEG